MRVMNWDSDDSRTLHEEYSAVPLDEKEYFCASQVERQEYLVGGLFKAVLVVFFIAIGSFTLGFGIGNNWKEWSRWEVDENGLLPPQAVVPDIPTKEVVFEFPTQYQDTGPEGDKLWNDLMPVGSGFVRVPWPRRFDMPPSKAIPKDPEYAEVYSLSVTHQLHCLGVLRDVIRKYEKKDGDRSRFAGDGHEYHCLDYRRQAVLCAGDTTLDYAGIVIGDDGSQRRLGFSGEGSTHQCRDWGAISSWAVENRSGEKKSIV
ncbi:hypothetical protein NA56DRAFT_432288 [Hyaloscypha hepaticicola]|uniref:Uncharacterized protein n=1 Tax=Hyaloscypha hepaticicola TaxID=2082293 RepID=A0A2J6QGE7_9HELO|nr:hypothetical protein NA56DRAFT_432288 [Hyaloscypha hepaticicola]